MSERLALFEHVGQFVKGHFNDQSRELWGLLFEIQFAFGISGDLLEIGVLQGKSAAWSMLHMQPGERHFLVDRVRPAELDRIISELNLASSAVAFIGGDSGELAASIPDGLRWIHIDGDHSFEAVISDAANYGRKVSDGGIIVFDDFFDPRWAEVTDAVLLFLRQEGKALGLCPFMMGFGKLYVSTQAAAERYLDGLVTRLPSVIGEKYPKVECVMLHLCGADVLSLKTWPKLEPGGALRNGIRDYTLDLGVPY